MDMPPGVVPPYLVLYPVNSATFDGRETFSQASQITKRPNSAVLEHSFHQELDP